MVFRELKKKCQFGKPLMLERKAWSEKDRIDWVSNISCTPVTLIAWKKSQKYNSTVYYSCWASRSISVLLLFLFSSSMQHLFLDIFNPWQLKVSTGTCSAFFFFFLKQILQQPGKPSIPSPFFSSSPLHTYVNTSMYYGLGGCRQTQKKRRRERRFERKTERKKEEAVELNQLEKKQQQQASKRGSSGGGGSSSSSLESRCLSLASQARPPTESLSRIHLKAAKIRHTSW